MADRAGRPSLPHCHPGARPWDEANRAQTNSWTESAVLQRPHRIPEWMRARYWSTPSLQRSQFAEKIPGRAQSLNLAQLPATVPGDRYARSWPWQALYSIHSQISYLNRNIRWV